MKSEKKSFCGNKEKYCEYLRGDRTWENGLYVDPDTTHQLGRDSEFYIWLEEYLNAMETKHFKGKWKYTMVGPSKGNSVPSGIRVCESDKSDKAVMYLRSDQLGFSAPQKSDKRRAWDNRYPYGKYISLKPNECDIVADIIWDTRSQGGSFIWPIIKDESKKGITWKSQYNISRGVKSYIEDRADITLWEVKKFYVDWNKYKENGGTDEETFFNTMKDSEIVLYSGSDKYMLLKWLAHFESFSKYVQFFSFDSFLIAGTENIVNLVNGEELTEDYISDIKKERNNRIASIEDSGTILGILKRLQVQTNSRTTAMLKRVSSES